MTTVDCGLCGTSFDPSLHSACGSCPIGGHCTLACCPSCGYTTIDLERSAPARFVDRLFNGSRRAPKNAADSVLMARPGDSVRIEAFRESMSPNHVALLRTYGIDVGRTVKVVQHRPMTVLEVDQTEVALESELAELILVRQSARPY